MALGTADFFVVAAAVGICVGLDLRNGNAVSTRALVLVGVGAPLAWLVAMSRQCLYQARSVARRLEEFQRLVRASGAAIAMLALASYLSGTVVPRAWVLTVPVLALSLLTVEREAARRIFIRLRRRGAMRRPVIVVGANAEALEIAAVERDPKEGYAVVGFVSDMPLDVIDPAIRDRVLGSVDDLEQIVAETGAVGVIVATTAVTTPVSNRIARRLTEAGIHVQLTSSLRDIVTERLTVNQVGRHPTLYVEAVRRGGWRATAKRLFDIAIAGGALVLLLPVLLLVAVLVKLTSRGPVLFRQERVGLDGQPFSILKFRSMVHNAEALLIDLRDRNEADGPLFKMRHDPRVTRVGALLRRTSLDELPQLWNVVRGEMSLVGPRPALRHEIPSWPPEMRDRLRVKPGITGLWQVNGRSFATFDDYVRLDMLYVDNWSLLTDLAILARTVPVVLLGRGAL